MTHYCFNNGSITSTDHASWPINDLGLLRGYGLFEYFRSYNHKIFRVNDYLDRLFNSAAALKLEIPYTRDFLMGTLEALNKHTDRPDIAFRILLTGGESSNGTTSHQTRFAIWTEDLPADVDNPKPVKIMTAEHLRELPHVKSTNYLRLMLAQKEFSARDVQDVLYVWQGQVLECSRSNIFLVTNKKLITPKNNILSGISRRTVIEIAKDRYPVEERDVSVDELETADEIFSSISSKRIVPVLQIDHHMVGGGDIGPVTRHLIQLFNDFTTQL